MSNNLKSCAGVEKMSPLDEFIKRIYSESDRVSGMAEDVRYVTDRLAGVIERDPESESDVPEQICQFDKLNYAIFRLGKAIDDMGFESARLSDRT